MLGTSVYYAISDSDDDTSGNLTRQSFGFHQEKKKVYG